MAGVIPVSKLDDSGPGSLRGAISIAAPGDSIDFLVAGEIVLDSQIVINKNLSILGPGADILALTTQDSTRFFLIESEDTVFISGLRFYNGNGTGYDPPSGGAISNQGVLSVESSIFHDNRATIGGAIENQGFGSSSNFLSIRNCSFYNNLAIQPIPGFIELGGALYADARGGGVSEMEVFNSTFANNQAKISGGAIFTYTDGGGLASLSMVNCTVAFNSVEGRCGGVDVSQAEAVQLKNCLIAENEGREDILNVFGAMQSGGNNLISDTGSVVLVNTVNTDIFDVDAELGPFSLNGGIFPTVSLACGSPAIDAGDDTAAPSLDLRGQARIGTSDIGAFERNEIEDLRIRNLNDAGYGSLRQAIELSCPGDSLTLEEVFGVIGLASTLTIQQNQYISGGSDSPVFLSGGDSIRIMYVEPGVELRVNNLNFEKGNPLNFGGGAIMNKGSLWVSNSSFRLNQARGGGAIANYGDLGPASLNLSNCSFAENEALFLDGGAIDNRPFSNGATAQITHCSYVQNSSANFGGAVFNGGELSIVNSLFGNNFALQGKQLYGPISHLGINLIQDTADIQWMNPVNADDFVIESPQTEMLDYYGGASFSLRLRAGSPAIDAGDNAFATSFDQRGVPRIFNGTVDLGAYEYDPATSIQASLESQEAYVYPQPSKGVFTLVWEKAAGQNVSASLLDIQGRIIERSIFQLDSSGEYSYMDATLAPGFYVIRLQQGADIRSLRLHILH